MYNKNKSVIYTINKKGKNYDFEKNFKKFKVNFKIKNQNFNFLNQKSKILNKDINYKFNRFIFVFNYIKYRKQNYMSFNFFRNYKGLVSYKKINRNENFDIDLNFKFLFLNSLKEFKTF